VQNFLTPAHREYVKHYAGVLADGIADVEPSSHKQVHIDLDALANTSAETPKPDFYHPGIRLQTRFRCGTSSRSMTFVVGMASAAVAG
jgi:hypothetical protein